jgi:hypothetical protein
MPSPASVLQRGAWSSCYIGPLASVSQRWCTAGPSPSRSRRGFAAAAVTAVVVAWLPALASHALAAVSAAERAFLSDLYSATGGSSWDPVPTGWSGLGTGADPCTPTAWGGITCATSPDRIVYVVVQSSSSHRTAAL